jgi:membrane protease YdiL (CAAX protease family)
MEIHLQKFKLCFQKCREYNINLNLEKCIFLVLFGVILGFILSKEGRLPYPKEIHVIMNMPIPQNSYIFKCSMVWHNFTNALSRIL